MNTKILEDVIYELDSEKEEYIQLESDISIAELIKTPEATHSVFAFVDHKHICIWLWYGCNTNIREKFLGSFKSTPIKIDEKTVFTRAVFQYDESIQFKKFIGIIEERDLLQSHIIDQIHTLPKIEGYKREMIIAQNKIFRFIENDNGGKLFEIGSDSQYMELDMKTRIVYNGQHIDFIEYYIPQ